MNDIEQILKASAVRVENEMKKYFENSDVDAEIIYDAERYSLFGGGKRIRPFLVYEFCHLFGGDEAAAAPFACAVEMIHTYSLIHDDLPCMDNDDYRRGRLTNHKMFGEATAVLAGDALLTGAFGVAASNKYVGDGDIVRAISEISRAAGDCGMVKGQVLDMLAENTSATSVDIDNLRKIQSLKTGELIRLSSRLGCIAAGVGQDDDRLKDADIFSDNIGLAFQIIDDILDVIGDSSQLGKSTGSDQRDNKLTFLSFYGVDEAKEYAKRLTQNAVDAISKYDGSEVLCNLAWFLAERIY